MIGMRSMIRSRSRGCGATGGTYTGGGAAGHTPVLVQAVRKRAARTAGGCGRDLGCRRNGGDHGLRDNGARRAQ